MAATAAGVRMTPADAVKLAHQHSLPQLAIMVEQLQAEIRGLEDQVGTQAQTIARYQVETARLRAIAEQYASECGECAGVGINIHNEDCTECKFIRDVLKPVMS